MPEVLRAMGLARRQAVAGGWTLNVEEIPALEVEATRLTRGDVASSRGGWFASLGKPRRVTSPRPLPRGRS